MALVISLYQQLRQFGKISGIYFATTFINSGIPFLLLPILTNHLTPSEYSKIAIYGLVLAISNSIIGITMPAFISKNYFKSEQQDIAKITTNSLILSFIFALITILAILYFYPLLHQLIKLPLYLMLTVPLTSFLWIVFSIGLTILRNRGEANLFSIHLLTNTFLNTLITIVFVAVILVGWPGRVYGITASYAASSVIILSFLRRAGYLNNRYSFSTMRSIATFILPLVPNSLQTVLIMQMAIVFFSVYFSEDLLGIYSVAFQISFLLYLLSKTLSLAWSPIIYRELSFPSTLDRRIYITRLYIFLFFILIAATIAINIFAPYILQVMTSPEYQAAELFIPYITLGLLFHGGYALLSPLLLHHEQQNFIGAISFVLLVCAYFSNIVAIDIFGYIGIVYSFSFIFCIMFIACLWRANRYHGFAWIDAFNYSGRNQ